jgi:hypothetical protein
MAASAINIFNNQGLTPAYRANDALQDHVQLAASQILVKGTLLGEVTATPGVYKAYASGSSDGSQVPRRILAYDCTTDGSGNVTLGGGDWGVTQKTAPAFFKGFFRSEDLTGLDANAVTPGVGMLKLVNGSVTAGVVELF